MDDVRGRNSTWHYNAWKKDYKILQYSSEADEPAKVPFVLNFLS